MRRFTIWFLLCAGLLAGCDDGGQASLNTSGQSTTAGAAGAACVTSFDCQLGLNCVDARCTTTACR